MKGLKAASAVMAIMMLAALSAAPAPAQAARPDAAVKGLWLTAPAFPDDPERVEVREFTDDQETGVTTYIRSLDGRVTLEIRRQPLEGSELQSPEDVRELIEMRVENDEIEEKPLAENRESIDVTTYVSDCAERFSFPCATAQYTTGANEDTTKNAALFLFTDTHSFEVALSLSPDAEEDYADQAGEWLESLRLAENKAEAAEAEVKGLWLEIPGLEGTAALETDENGTVVYAVQMDDGLTLTILRGPNPGNQITPERAAEFIAKLADISEDDVSVTVPEDGEAPFPAAEKYPFAMAEFKTGAEGEEIENAGLFFFPEELFFFLRLEAANEDIIEGRQDDLERWFKNMKFVEK